ncbi:unnamed protein product [Moneuplotes crassus]|uniref:Uncharacterized protein n=1 Tax=Euplotes crassus TaxID=5936 RepID=A0AAD1XH57_EUPCR|nr:unnamed protein product [Moneuplotes crassus]
MWEDNLNSLKNLELKAIKSENAISRYLRRCQMSYSYNNTNKMLVLNFFKDFENCEKFLKLSKWRKFDGLKKIWIISNCDKHNNEAYSNMAKDIVDLMPPILESLVISSSTQALSITTHKNIIAKLVNSKEKVEVSKISCFFFNFDEDS